jgi:hypothetical protein
MKNLILSVLFLFPTLLVFGQSEKILLKSFQLTANNISIDVNIDKTIHNWDRNYIKIELQIKSNISQTSLDKINNLGMFNFESKVENSTQIITLPKLNSNYKINDITPKNTYFMKVWIPTNLQVVDVLSVEL